MTYSRHLPKVFPYHYQAPPEEITRLVKLILDPERKDVPQGSSFAVTVDNWDNTWNLWMSLATKRFLADKLPRSWQEVDD